GRCTRGARSLGAVWRRAARRTVPLASVCRPAPPARAGARPGLGGRRATGTVCQRSAAIPKRAEGPARATSRTRRRPARGADTARPGLSEPGPRDASLDDLRDPTGADGPATLADGEAEALLHGDRLDELDRHLGVVAG